jgi:hypothetical protein
MNYTYAERGTGERLSRAAGVQKDERKEHAAIDILL